MAKGSVLVLLALVAVALAQSVVVPIDSEAAGFVFETTGTLHDDVMIDLHQDVIVETTNTTMGYQLDEWAQMTPAERAAAPNDITFTITVKEIADALAGGGTNPIEKVIIQKILAALAKAGITVRAGALVFDAPNGPAIKLVDGCDVSAELRGGWDAHATLKPGTSISISFGFDGLTLIVKTNLHTDCSFGMGGTVHADVGKKIFGKCIRIGKSVGVQMGGDMILDIYSQLTLQPSLVQVGDKWGIKFTPTLWLNGKLVYFEPSAHADFKIFGIHIRFIEKAIKDTITKQMQRIITPGRVQTELAKLQTAIQASLTQFFNGAVIIIDGNLTPQLHQAVNGAVVNIVNKQRI